jgi:hypothetical protein
MNIAKLPELLRKPLRSMTSLTPQQFKRHRLRLRQGEKRSKRRGVYWRLQYSYERIPPYLLDHTLIAYRFAGPRSSVATRPLALSASHNPQFHPPDFVWQPNFALMVNVG